METLAQIVDHVRQDDHLRWSLVKRLSDEQVKTLTDELMTEVKSRAVPMTNPFAGYSTYNSMELHEVVRFVETRVMEKQRYTWSEFLFDAFVGTVAGVVIFGAIEALHPAVCW